MFIRRREILEHMARGDELIQQIRESIDRFSEDARADRERLDEQWREQLQITREVIRRNEIASQESSTALRHVLGRMEAQTKALFAVIDRLNGGAQAGTA